MRVAGQQQQAPQPLQVRVRDHGLHQPFRDTFAAMALEHEHICEQCKSGMVGDNAGEADLGAALIDPEA
jgi:hypothetical protein